MNSQTAFIMKALLPALIALIIFGLGLALTPADFARVLKEPKVIIIGLLTKLLALPALAYALGLLFKLDPTFAIGLLVLSACPTSAIANVFTNLGRGDVALALSLTALNNVVGMVTLPVTAVVAAKIFQGDSQPVQVDATELVKIVLIFLIPVVLGMRVRAKRPELSMRLEKVLKIISIVVLVVLIAGVISKEYNSMVEHAATLSGVIICFNLGCVAIGFAFAKALKLPRAPALSSAMFMALQSTAIGITVAVSLLGNVSYAMPSAFFSLSMYAVAAPISIANARSHVPRD